MAPVSSTRTADVAVTLVSGARRGYELMTGPEFLEAGIDETVRGAEIDDEPVAVAHAEELTHHLGTVSVTRADLRSRPATRPASWARPA